MHTVIERNGVQANVIIIPDADSEVINVGGTHSVRGGALAQKLYRQAGPTSDRYLTPMLKGPRPAHPHPVGDGHRPHGRTVPTRDR
jgi:hypothetical protein